MSMYAIAQTILSDSLVGYNWMSRWKHSDRQVDPFPRHHYNSESGQAGPLRLN